MRTAGNSSLPLRCWAEIDLDALERNLRLIRASLPPHMRYVAVVKADAYGHGLHQASAALMHAGADLFAVANIAEAAALRELSADWPILLLSPVIPAEDRHLAELNVAVTISTHEELARFDAVGKEAGHPLPVHLKIDTGMGRLGVWHEEAPALVDALLKAPHLHLAGIFTHFAAPDDDPAFTQLQRERFLSALAACPGLDLTQLFIHADNSAGLESIATAGPFNAVRIGLLQFGILPRTGSLLAQVSTEPVFSFRTRVGIVKRLPAGTTISYGRTHTLEKATTVAILCAGYGDGISRATSNKGSVLIHGHRCPILGRVTMDQTIVDVSAVPQVGSGDEAVIVGTQNGNSISISEFSEWADTIPWEVLCSVTKRVPRLYRTALGL